MPNSGEDKVRWRTRLEGLEIMGESFVEFDDVITREYGKARGLCR